MTQQPYCDYCHDPIPRSVSSCPHCGQSVYFPNVRDAGESDEVDALEKRYKEAQTDAEIRGAKDVLDNFENSVKDSVAVIARSSNELLRLATSDNEIYATYYELIDAGVRSYTDDEISLFRAIADEVLFPGYKKNIRFAALTLNDLGVISYGDCSAVLRTDRIAHRASVFEENSTVFIAHHKPYLKIREANKIPFGYRATWGTRSKLCVAKLFKRIDSTITTSQYPEVLLRQGTTTANADFVEVHIWGPLTARTIERVTLMGGSDEYQHVIMEALKEKLEKANVAVELKVKP